MTQQLTLKVQPNGTYKLSKIRKKKRAIAKVIYIKVKLFFWNLSPIHWYDTFKDIHVDMNEFISPKKKHLKK
jgi:hypothetical protein